ncbi:hypothetical protein fHeYen901_5 [Yersinia phage fHe-Yen9-01]|uniref:DUF7418 domain-containing protein n=1 Tax=Yersinia phage fHe-Yen9-01 TaxID=1965363 RepID=A0A1V0DXA0_9CAUD|nr:hypothetical protein KNT60_gp004 [Yersinia phage fHe-Yen9-01]ARB05778.1 hypothetical protein fHeYen901_5 [Yersinia phage fHe-Yen9-01]
MIHPMRISDVANSYLHGEHKATNIYAKDIQLHANAKYGSMTCKDATICDVSSLDLNALNEDDRVYYGVLHLSELLTDEEQQRLEETSIDKAFFDVREGFNS